MMSLFLFILRYVLHLHNSCQCLITENILFWKKNQQRPVFGASFSANFTQLGLHFFFKMGPHKIKLFVLNNTINCNVVQ